MMQPLRKVVIPAAGLGTRFLPATKAVPKEMLPIFDVPTLQLNLEETVRARVSMQTGKAGVALMPVPDDQAHLYGVAAGPQLEGGNVQVEKIVEKPPRGTAPSNLAVIGRYVLPPDVFDILEKVKPGAGGEIQLTDALAVLAKAGRLIGVRFKGERYDAGDRLGYL